MNSKQQPQTLEDVVTSTLFNNQPIPTEQDIEKLVLMYNTLPIYGYEAHTVKEIIKRIHANFHITMDIGQGVYDPETHQPWLSGRKATILPFFWDRYKKYLQYDSWAPQVLSKLDIVTDEIIDAFGNPEEKNNWKRRGMVVGDVQSGKTATYTALICKAADAGYRVIVLLTGVLESLRKQTQERLDMGFVGVDSAGLLTRNKSNSRIGAGKIAHQKMAVVFTSRTDDFKTSNMHNLNLRIGSVNEPILLVVKKNKKILENLNNWLKTHNADDSGKIRSTPALIIDDEADNASVNTNDTQFDDNSPTAINQQIRILLDLFDQNTFVGFTATPFANIFINPDSTHEMSGDDLFPRDFIYSLESPTNYVGAEKIFLDRENDQLSDILVTITDIDTILPLNHKSSFRINELPQSLVDAIYTFALSTTIRDIRNTEKRNSHRSMLVNVSRFTVVQNHVRNLIGVELSKIQDAVRNYAGLSYKEAINSSFEIKKLYEVWKKYFFSLDTSWSDIQKQLHESIAPILTKAINQSNQDRLNYAENKDAGLRVIAVGGNSLSRGLTLEGLSVSYFYRNTQMYDTLLQMGRWFGYRNGYEDLCRIWLEDTAIGWYTHITEVSRELRDEIKHMNRLGSKPIDFGLKVRSHPHSLLVTARNKMRSAQDFERVISFSDSSQDTAVLPFKKDILELNKKITFEFVGDLIEKFGNPNKTAKGNFIWRNIPKQIVADYIRGFQSHPTDIFFLEDVLEDFIASTDVPKLATWDIVIPFPRDSNLAPISIGGLNINSRIRTLKVSQDSNSIYIGGNKFRVSDPSDQGESLDLEQIENIKNEYRNKNPGKTIPGNEYRKKMSKPLLLVNFVKSKDDLPEFFERGIYGIPLIALCIAFPEFKDDESRRVRYKINLVEYRRLFGDSLDEESDAL